LEVRLEDVTVRYGKTTALESASLALRGPGLVALLGPNGAGKTTLLRAILGLVRPVRGRILIDGEDVTSRPMLVGRHASYVPQRPPTGKYTPFTPWELVCTALLLRERWPRTGCRESHRVEEALALAGVPGEAWHRRLSELSGGMLMRSFIARSLALGTRILLMDEPLAPVDPAGRSSLARLIEDLAEKRLVIVSLHDPMLFRRLDWIVLLNRRVIASGPPSRVLRRDTLERVYGSLAIEVGAGHVHLADWHVGEG